MFYIKASKFNLFNLFECLAYRGFQTVLLCGIDLNISKMYQLMLIFGVLPALGAHRLVTLSNNLDLVLLESLSAFRVNAHFSI